MKDEKEFLKHIKPFDFDDMDGNIECPNCGTKMHLDPTWPSEEYVEFGFRASDVYACPKCNFNAIITSCYVLDHKEVEYYLDDMEEEA